MSFGTPQRVLNLRRDYEKSLRHLSDRPGSNQLDMTADSLDLGDVEDAGSPMSPVRGFGGYSSARKGRSGRAPLSSGSHNHSHNNNNNNNNHSSHIYNDADKDEIILDLREEVDRLKAKVNKIVESAEGSLQEAIESQQSLKADYEARAAAKETEAAHATAESAVLKELVNRLQRELAYEREQVHKSMRFMDRIKGSTSSSGGRVQSHLDKNIFKAHVNQY